MEWDPRPVLSSVLQKRGRCPPPALLMLLKRDGLGGGLRTSGLIILEPLLLLLRGERKVA